MKVRVIAILLFLALAFAALRAYGFYQQETAKASQRAREMYDESRQERKTAETLRQNLDCKEEWLKYGATGKKGKPPVCPDMLGNHFLTAGIEELDHNQKADGLLRMAKQEQSYAGDRLAQTGVMFHAVWYTVTGQPRSELDEIKARYQAQEAQGKK